MDTAAEITVVGGALAMAKSVTAGDMAAPLAVRSVAGQVQLSTLDVSGPVILTSSGGTVVAVSAVACLAAPSRCNFTAESALLVPTPRHPLSRHLFSVSTLTFACTATAVVCTRRRGLSTGSTQVTSSCPRS